MINKIKYIPPHQINKKKGFDTDGYFPTKESALNYSKGFGSEVSYHKDRFNSIDYLLKDIRRKKNLVILDYGCGDGLLFKKLKMKTQLYWGIDASSHMIELANKNLASLNKKLISGGVEKLKKIKSNSIDLVTSFNVLGYLKETDLNIIFKEIHRILKKNGFFATINGNELFDMFALNYNTKIFYKKYFNQKENHMNWLLKKNKKTNYIPAKRFNPLEFSERLKIKYKLKKIDTAFSSLHKYSPEVGKIINKSKKSKNKLFTDFRYRQLLARNFNINPNKFSFSDKWKCYFLCSIFGMLFRK